MPDSNHFIENEDIQSRLVFGNNTSDDIALSIVIPTYKRIDLLRKNIKAILTQINLEKAVPYEVVIVANNPDFDYKELELELDYNVFKIYVNNENLGMCGNMNRCAVLARGTYIAYIQDDDVLMTNYIEEISNLIKSGELKNIDWLIPNRYYLMPDTGRESQFGKKAIGNMKIKRAIGTVLRMGRAIPMYQKITPYETLVTTYPFYAGGPTCGMLFKKESLLLSGGFDTRYPYGFDYVFFIQFSKKYNVVLYNKYLSLYMTSDSASNKPEVQYDFFRARYDSLVENSVKYEIPSKLKRVILYTTYLGYPQKTKEIIDESYEITRSSFVFNKPYLVWAMLRTYKSGGYRRKECPKLLISWYLTL